MKETKEDLNKSKTPTTDLPKELEKAVSKLNSQLHYNRCGANQSRD